MMGPISMFILRFNKSFPDKVILMLLSIRGFLTLDLKDKAMNRSVVFSLGVVRDTRVGVWPVGMVVMGVVRVDTWRRIALRRMLM